MSMQGLPRVPLSTGSVTGLPPASSVTWSRSDTVHSYSRGLVIRGAAAGAKRWLVWEKRRRRPPRRGRLSHNPCPARSTRGRIPAGRKRERPPAGGRCMLPGPARGRARGALGLLGVALAELVDPTAGVHDLVLPGVERVRGRGHLDLDQRILVAILPLDRLLGGGAQGGTGEDLEIRGHVLEHDFAVFGVDIGLHGGTGITGSRAV